MDSAAKAAWSSRPRIDRDKIRAFWETLEEGERFFMGTAKVQQAMRKLGRLLGEAGIPYAIVGGMALNLHGYRRFTADVNVLPTSEGLQEFKRRHLGLGYAERFAGSKNLIDTVSGVQIDVLLSGAYPGDGLPKPVFFPEPQKVAERDDGIAVVSLPVLIDLKLASGLSAPHRAKDIVDVLELIRATKPERTLAEQLSPYVRDKFLELWDIDANAPQEDPS